MPAWFKTELTLSLVAIFMAVASMAAPDRPTALVMSGFGFALASISLISNYRRRRSAR